MPPKFESAYLPQNRLNRLPSYTIFKSLYFSCGKIKLFQFSMFFSIFLTDVIKSCFFVSMFGCYVPFFL